MDELAWETTGTDVDYRCPGFDVRRDEVQFPNGTDAEYHYVDEPPAVVVLPFTPDGDVVVIDEWRQAVGRVNRGLPAGTVERTDSDRTGTDDRTGGSDRSGVGNRTGAGDGPRPALERAAARELAEETGYEAGAFEHLITVEPSNGIANSLHHHFLATGCEPTAEQDLDHNESISVDRVDYDELLAGVVDGDVRDGRTATSVLQYELTRR